MSQKHISLFIFKIETISRSSSQKRGLAIPLFWDVKLYLKMKEKDMQELSSGLENTKTMIEALKWHLEGLFCRKIISFSSKNHLENEKISFDHQEIFIWKSWNVYIAKVQFLFQRFSLKFTVFCLSSFQKLQLEFWNCWPCKL